MTDRSDGGSPDETNFESTIEHGVAVVSEVPGDVLAASLNDGIANILPIAVQRSLAAWAEEAHGDRRHSRPLFHRDKYVTPGKVYEQMAMAYDSLDDDVVGNVADMSEAMAFQKVGFECPEDKDQENVWGQIGKDLDLDSFVRQMWRELFTVSQVYPVRFWGRKTYKVKGKREKRQARKEYDLVVPTQLGFLDPLRVVPVKVDPFGNAQLAWIATDSEMELYGKDKPTVQTDDVVKAMFLGEYKPTKKEEAEFGKESIPPDSLMLLNPQFVWRHTATKSPFERWSRVRMKSLFPILDLKHQLREMDRAFLLGGINFIVLVTRGTDQIPTTKTEVDQTTAQIRAQSKSPVIVSDHRISIEIITPDVEHILDAKKWAVLDERLLMRLWGTFALATANSGRETSLTTGRVIARGLASRRHMMKRSIEREVIRMVTSNPLNEAQEFGADTSIEFAPRRMELEFDESVVTMIQSLRDRGDISRETVLTEFNFDQDLEAARREYEDERYPDVFEPVNVPFDSPDKTTPDGSGRTGGRPKTKTTGDS